jgi:hypothetical protein
MNFISPQLIADVTQSEIVTKSALVVLWLPEKRIVVLWEMFPANYA